MHRRRVEPAKDNDGCQFAAGTGRGFRPIPDTDAESTAGVVHRSIDHSLLPDLVDRVEALMRATPAASQRVLLAMHLLLYHTWLDHHDRAEQIVKLIGPFGRCT
jgi:hypothetical protein